MHRILRLIIIPLLFIGPFSKGTIAATPETYRYFPQNLCQNQALAAPAGTAIHVLSGIVISSVFLGWVLQDQSHHTFTRLGAGALFLTTVDPTPLIERARALYRKSIQFLFDDAERRFSEAAQDKNSYALSEALHLQAKIAGELLFHPSNFKTAVSLLQSSYQRTLNEVALRDMSRSINPVVVEMASDPS